MKLISPLRSTYQRKTPALVMIFCASRRSDTVSSVSPACTVKFTGAPASPGGLSWRLSHSPAPPATSRMATRMMSTV